MVLGVGFSLLVHLYRELTVTVDHQSSDRVLVVAPRGVLWFATVPLVERLIRNSLASCPELSTVIVDLAGVGRLDYTGAAALRRLVDEVSAGGVDVHLRNIGQGSIRAANIHLDSEASSTEHASL